MGKFIVLTVLLTFFAASSPAREIEKTGLPELENIFSGTEDVLHVVNFRATWCPPCVTELPYFGKLSEDYQGRRLYHQME